MESAGLREESRVMVLKLDRSYLLPNSSIQVGVINIRWIISAQELHMGEKEGLNIKETIIAVKSQDLGRVRKQSA